MRNYFKYFILVLFLMGGVATSFAQYEKTSGNKNQKQQEKKQPLQKRDRWFVGGMFGGGYGDYTDYSEWFIQLAPQVGYKITPSFHVGTQITYIYNGIKLKAFGTIPEETINLNHYGASLYGRYIIFKGLFAQVEYEALNYDYDDYREWINSLLIGGGYYQGVGRSFVSIAILFNVIDNPYYPQGYPVMRIGFGVGF